MKELFSKINYLFSGLTCNLNRSSCLSASIFACVIVGAAEPLLRLAVVRGKSWNCNFCMACTRSCSGSPLGRWVLPLLLTGVTLPSLELDPSEFGAVNVPELEPGLGLWCGYIIGLPSYKRSKPHFRKHLKPQLSRLTLCENRIYTYRRLWLSR